jgi:hypothetical protein
MRASPCARKQGSHKGRPYIVDAERSVMTPEAEKRRVLAPLPGRIAIGPDHAGADPGQETDDQHRNGESEPENHCASPEAQEAMLGWLYVVVAEYGFNVASDT